VNEVLRCERLADTASVDAGTRGDAGFVAAQVFTLTSAVFTPKVSPWASTRASALRSVSPASRTMFWNGMAP